MIVMLKEILSEKDINLIADKQTNALKLYAAIFNLEKQKKKFKLLRPLKSAGFSLAEARLLDYKAGVRIWKKCDIGQTRNNGGRPGIKKSLINDINIYMNKISHPAANRYLIKLRKNARYREGTYRDAFHTCPFKDKLSLGTFRRKLCKSFKKPHRISDLCDICESGQVLK
jgi:hypothetical protein